MDLATFHELLTPHGQIILNEMTALQPTAKTALQCQQRLRKRFPEHLVRAAFEQVLLRGKAQSKFRQAGQMYFDREALEQASGETIAGYRAVRFEPYSRVGDFCCGIGGDLLALADRVNSQRFVWGIDNDPLRAEMAQVNRRVMAEPERIEVVCADLLTIPLPELNAAFLDPDRRTEGRRQITISEYQPSLDLVRQRLPQDFPLAVKVAPGVSSMDWEQYDAEVEFISVDGELKECVLWFGALRDVRHRATVLRSNAVVEQTNAPQVSRLEADSLPMSAEPELPQAYLYDPDPAVMRSGLLPQLEEMLEAAPLDGVLSYLTSTQRQDSHFAKRFRVIESLPFHVQRLREMLRTHNMGHVTMHKRACNIDTEELRPKLKLQGTENGHLFLTTVMGKNFAILAQNDD